MTEQPATTTLQSIPKPVTAADRLLSLYKSPAPYTSVYMATLPVMKSGREHMLERWQVLRSDLEAQGSPLAALNAIEARLTLPKPDDTAGIAIIAAADGATIVDHGLEPPRIDLGVVGSLPYSAPLLEWQQRRVAHLVVTADVDGIDIAIFGLDHFTRLDSYQLQLDDAVAPIVETAAAIDAELIVLSGTIADATPLADRLAVALPATTRLAIETECTNAEELAEAAVRHVSDIAARATVADLQDQRFLAAHEAAVEGTGETINALRDGTAGLVLVHDDPDDQHRIWIGHGAQELSHEQKPGFVQARAVDAIIRSAVLQQLPIRIIPSTGPNGPNDDTAAVIVDDGGGAS